MSTEDKNGSQAFSFEISEYDPDNEGLERNNQQIYENNKYVGDSDNQRLTASIDVLLQSKETTKELKEVLPIKDEDLEQLLNKLPKELQSKVKKTKQTIDKEDDSWKIDFVVELNRSISRQIPSKSERLNVSIPSEKSIISEDELEIQLDQLKDAEEKRQKKSLGEDAGIDEEMTEEEMRKQETRKLLRDTRNRANSKGEEESSKKFKVVRYVPEGPMDYNSIKFVGITFSQPLVPEGKDIDYLTWRPTITPNPLKSDESKWILHNQYTLIYECPDNSWANSHEYTVKISSTNAVSALNQKLNRDFQFSFTTPTISILDQIPAFNTEKERLNPFFFIGFDQQIDATSFINQLKSFILIDRNTTREYSSMVLVDPFKETMDNQEIKELAKRYKEGYYVSFRSTIPFPHSSIVILPLLNISSTEGPLVSQDINAITFLTVDPLSVYGSHCYVDNTNEIEYVYLTFNQPIATEQQSSFESLRWKPLIGPEPPVKGTWTLENKYTLKLSKTRWANATHYTITLPIGTPSGKDDILLTDYVYHFNTEAVSLLKMYPNTGYLGLLPILICCFDQIVDPEEIVKNIKLYVGGLLGTKNSARLATAEEIKTLSDPTLKKMMSEEKEGYYVVFTTIKSFPYDSQITIKLGPNVPSKEGPLLSPIERTFTFNTISPFAVSSANYSNGSVNITFNQDLIYDTQSVDINELKWRPTITPNIGKPDHWKLVSPRQLVLIPDPPFPNSTSYTVKIPSGITSVMNDTLSKEFVYSFVTGLIRLLQKYPNPSSNTALSSAWTTINTVLFMSFDQQIDPKEISNLIRCEAKGKKQALTLLNPNRANLEYPVIRPLLKNTQDGKWLALIPTKPFPYDSKVTVSLGPGIPSLEGPVKSDIEESFSFQTVPIFAVSNYNIEYQARRIDIQFNQPLVHDNESIDHLNWRPDITPIPEGNGNWILKNPSLLSYGGDIQFTNSTKYTIKITKGCGSAMKEQFDNDVIYEFSTPVVKVVKYYPKEGLHSPTPVCLVAFDQLIDADAILKTVRFSIDPKGSAVYSGARLATKEEMQEDKKLPLIINECVDGKYLIFTTTKPFPRSAKVSVKMGPIISKEGPLRPNEDFTFSFFTITGLTAKVHITSASQPFAAIYIVFNQSIAENDDIANLTWRPHISPDPPQGNWIMQRSPYTTDISLIFTPEVKWKRSSKYTVKVPAGVISVYKESLPRESIMEFSTPTTQVEKPFPITNTSFPVKTNPVLVVKFDQIIDPEEVIKVVKFKTSTFNSALLNARLATKVEIEKEETLKNLVLDNFFLAFCPLKPFPNNEKVSCTIGPNIPSADGPLKSLDKFSFNFQTIPPFMPVSFNPVDRSRVNIGSSLNINFTNTIDASSFDTTTMLKIDPPIPGAQIQMSGKTFTIKGTEHNPQQSNEDLHYKIIISRGLKDEYEQLLDKEVEYHVTLCCTSFFCSLVSPAQGVVTYDPLLSESNGKSPTFLVQATNYKEIRILLYKLDPFTDLRKWHNFEQNIQLLLREKSDQIDYLGFGKLVSDKIVKIESFKKFATTNINIDLSPALEEDKRTGQVGVVVCPTIKAHYPNEWQLRPIVKAWIQCTSMSLEVIQGLKEMYIWATDLIKGGPLAGVKIEKLERLEAPVDPLADSHSGNDSMRKSMPLERPKTPQVTNKDGLLLLPHPTTSSAAIIAQKGKDVVFMEGITSIVKGNSFTKLLWHVFDDRSMYRPNEDVKIKGYVRWLKLSESDRLEKLELPSFNKIYYKVYDNLGNDYFQDEAFISNIYASFLITIPLSDWEISSNTTLFIDFDIDTPIGDYYKYTHSVFVQDLRPPEQLAHSTLYNNINNNIISLDSKPIIKTHAKFFNGNALAERNVTWNVTSQPTVYIPPGLPSSFVFTIPEFIDVKGQSNVVCKRSLNSITDDDGSNYIKIMFKGISDPPQPVNIFCLSEVQGLNNMLLRSATRFTLHPCDYYVGLSLGKEGKAYFSEPYNIEIVVTDVYGTCIPDIPILLRMRKQIKPKTGSVRLSKKIKEVSLVSKSSPISYTILSQRVNCVGYQLMCIVNDSKNRMNASRAFLPVRAPSQSAQQLIGKKFGRVELDNVIITSDKAEYEIGDTAKLTVESPFSPCDGLISIRSNTILKVVYFSMEQSKSTVKVQITEEYAPNVLIQIDLVGKSSRRNYSSIIDLDAPKRPAMASGNITLNIPPLLKQLDLIVAPMDPNIEPGGETTVEVQVLDSFKQPFSKAEVALLVVDEAILSLTGYELTNPLNTFYPVRGDLFNSKRYSIRSIMPIEYLKPKTAAPASSSSPAQEREYRSEGDSDEESKENQDLTPQQQAAITTLNRSTMTPSRDTLHDIPDELRNRLEEILKSGEGSDTIVERASSISLDEISLTSSTEKRNKGRKSIGFSLGKLVDSLENTPMKGGKTPNRRPSNPTTPLRGSVARGSMDLNSSYSGLTDSHLGLSNSNSTSNNNNDNNIKDNVYFEDSYNPVAYFSGALTLDKYGKSSVRVVIPNRVSKFKIWAIAVSPDGKQFGIGDSLLSSRLPFSIRVLPPTYLNYNDNALIPFTIQNLTDKSIDISLAIRALNASLGDNLQEKLGFYANIPAQSIRTFPILMSTISAGRSTIQYTCVTDKYSESHEFHVHVYPPFNTETVAQFSDLRKYEQSVVNHIEVPNNSDKNYGGIKLTMSAAVVHLLADSVSYLCTYPYMSTELLASKLLVLLALHDKIDVIKKSTVPKYSQLKKIVVSTIKSFKERQNADGGYGLWRSSDSNEFLSIHVVHAIAVCKDRGYISNSISKKLWFQKLITYIINIEEAYSQQYDDPEKIALLSYFLFVKYKLQKSQEIKEEVEKFYMRNQIDSFPLEALGWVLSVLSDTSNDLERSRFTDEIVSYINKHAIINNNNNTAYFNSYYEDSSRHLLFHTPLRTDSVLLDALIAADTQSPVIPKLASHLLNSTKCNHWSNTQENCWATLALDKYFHVFENEGPDYTVRIWNNNKFCGETKIKGLLMTETMQFKMTMQSLLQFKNNNNDTPSSDIVIQKEGSGKLFYRLSIYYAPQSLDIVPHEFNGIEIYREITAVDAKEDLNGENNIYQVKLQKSVKITLTIKTLKQRHFVALIDKFAAGFKYCKSNNEDTKPWFDGNEKVAESTISLFVNNLNPGTYTYSYIVKASTVGNFVLPPARIEEMYRPDIHGQSSSCKLSVNV